MDSPPEHELKDWTGRGIAPIGWASQLFLIGAIVAAYFIYPVSYVRLIAEDNLGEFATFVALIIASALFMLMFVFGRGKERNYWHLLLALGTFFVGMEEISWGQRLMDVGTPEFLRNANIQGEITLHNLPGFSPDVAMYLFVSAAFAVYGLILPVLAAASIRVRALLTFVNLPVPSIYLAPIFTATAYFLAMNPRVAPTLFPILSPMAKSDEIAELLMGIAFGSFAIDQCIRKVQWLRRERHTPGWLIGSILVLPVAWLAFASILVPSLIEEAYAGRSLSLLNGLISGQAVNPVSTYLAQWELLTWMLLGNMAVFGALLIAFLKYRPEVGLPVVKQDWTANAAIPSFYLGTLAVALSFSLVADGDFNFGGRLNQLGGERLPALGHYQQAEKILAYLEEHPEHAREELLLNKGKLLALMGRPEEATAAFEAALAAELERYAEVPETAEVSRRLGLIYSSLGDSALSTSHFNAALEINRAAVDADEAPERRAQMYTQRAEIFADMGHHERAIVEYLSASKLVVSESMRHDIGQEIRQSLTECGRQDGNVTAEVDGAHRQSLDWEQVEQMARQLDQEHDAAAWCS